MKMARAKY